MGKKTWLPGKNLTKFISSYFGIQQHEQKEMIERITDSVSENAPLAREMMEKYPASGNGC
jgi:serine/threonine-protein kinase HipA